MNCWPIIVRELRAESRRAVHFRLRLLAGLAFTVFLAIQSATIAQVSAAVGANVFNSMSVSIYLCIWLTAPLLTADCLSKEKREGTLSLLFLTPLTALGIVIGKSLVQSLRALSFLFAAAPVMTVPYVMGGVTWSDIVSFVFIELSALALALGAGLLASSGPRLRRWAMVETAIWTLLFAFLHFQATRRVFMGGALSSATNLFAGSFVSFGIIVVIAAWRVRRTWQDKPLSRRQLWWIRTFCSPVFWQSLFRQATRRKLDQNPIKWLQFYSTWDRVAKWFWCGLALIFVTQWTLDDFRFGRHLLIMELLMALGLAYAAASSFRRERANGAFELIMVSPLTRRDIVSGRLWALWSQFFPAALALVIVSILIVQMFNNSRQETWAFLHAGLVCSTYWSLPIVGLFFSLSGGNFFKASLNTCFFGVLVPIVLARAGFLFFYRPATIEDGCALAFLYQVVYGSFLIGRLQHQILRLTVRPLG